MHRKANYARNSIRWIFTHTQRYNGNNKTWPIVKELPQDTKEYMWKGKKQNVRITEACEYR